MQTTEEKSFVSEMEEVVDMDTLDGKQDLEVFTEEKLEDKRRKVRRDKITKT